MRTLANTVDWLGDEFRFKIMTSDRDFGDAEPYGERPSGSWWPVGKAEVFYLPSQSPSLRALRNLIHSTEHDALYLNSFFSPAFAIKPLLLWRLGLIHKVPLILAPKGEFSPGALEIKSLKKRTYLTFAKAFRLYRGVVWQASNEYEEGDIRRWFGDHVPVMVAADLPPATLGTEPPRRRDKVAGRLKALFLSRVSRKKNLDGALRMLNGLTGDVQLDVYGPLEDEAYWAECQKIIDTLPRNVRVHYRGAVNHSRVAEVMAEYDLFFLPTLGENFGYVILEALLAGCPVLIGDQTPWRELRDKGVGWELPLDRPKLFEKVLQDCVTMSAEEHRLLARRAWSFGIEQVRNQDAVEQNRELFERVLSSTLAVCGRKE